MVDVELRVNRLRFKDWKRVSVRRSITALADSFVLQYIDTIASDDYPIKDGDKCELFFGDNRIMTGHVDVAEWGYTAGGPDSNTTHNFGVEGRSKTGDLVDSSVLEPKTWKSKTFETIAKELCEPFGILVKLTENVDPLVFKPIKSHSAEVGETVAECLGRIALKLGVLMRTDPSGILEIGRPPKVMEGSGISLGRDGGRIKSGSRRMDSRDRHDLYVAYGQRQGSDTLTADAAREGKQSARDPRITRHRPLVFQQEGGSDDGTLTRAAEWVRNVRSGAGQRVSYQVQGWEARKGQPWEPGKTVIVTDALLRLDAVPLIIESINYTFSRPTGGGGNGGSLAQMDLVMPESFQGLTPPTPPKEKDGVLVW